MGVDFRFFVQMKGRKRERKTRFKTFNTKALLFTGKMKKDLLKKLCHEILEMLKTSFVVC
jgi:hypothetical protein